MKKFRTLPFSLLLIGLLTLTGCFGGEEEEPTETPDETPNPIAERIAFYRLVEADDFTIQIPEDWETIQHFTSDYPPNTVVAFRNNKKDHEFVANINIVRNQVPDGTKTTDYGLQMFQTVASQLINFERISEKLVDLPGAPQGTQTFIYEFKGTNNHC